MLLEIQTRDKTCITTSVNTIKPLLRRNSWIQNNYMGTLLRDLLVLGQGRGKGRREEKGEKIRAGLI